MREMLHAFSFSRIKQSSTPFRSNFRQFSPPIFAICFAFHTEYNITDQSILQSLKRIFRYISFNHSYLNYLVEVFSSNGRSRINLR